jgi:hypothetical protein
MMKALIAAVVLVGTLATALAGQVVKYGVTVTAEKDVDFSRFKTYTWVEGQPSPLKTIHDQVVSAVERELKALGMTKAASGPGDVLVSYNAFSRIDVDVKAKPDEQGGLPQTPVGTLAVAFISHGDDHRRLLVLRAVNPISTDKSKLEAEINQMVAELFAQYPTRTKKPK